jgi:hypothetical protein
MGNFDVNQLTMSRGLLEDFKKYAARDKVVEIIGILQDQLNKNKTRTMTFTDDGLALAIKLIKDKYGIEG